MQKRDIDEYIEALWYLTEELEGGMEGLQGWIDETFDKDILAELAVEGIIKLINKKIEFTKQGYEKSRQIVRCHRLAERLLADVMGMKLREMEKGACEFEHILAPEIADSICTLLGHPSECPHGLKIPGGQCCVQVQNIIKSAIVPLSKVKTDDQVRVCYINTKSNTRMHKLSHFGIIPGSLIIVCQKNPSFVIQLDNSKLALENEIAKEIFVFYPTGETAKIQQKEKKFTSLNFIKKNFC